MRRESPEPSTTLNPFLMPMPFRNSEMTREPLSQEPGAPLNSAPRVLRRFSPMIFTLFLLYSVMMEERGSEKWV